MYLPTPSALFWLQSSFFQQYDPRQFGPNFF
jgi:hypothetical protein